VWANSNGHHQFCDRIDDGSINLLMSFGSSHLVIELLLLQPPLCGIVCRWTLEMGRLLKMFNPF